MIIAIILIVSVLYVGSLGSCIKYFTDKNIGFNIITFFMALCPILNFIVALKIINWKQLKRIFKNSEYSKIKK